MKTRITMALAAALALASVPAQAQLLAGEKDAPVAAIPGVIAAGAKWELVWADFMTADGMTGTEDGGILFAQEQSNSVRKLAPDGKAYVWMPGVAGAGAVSIDASGRVFSVERTCTDPGLHMPSCPELTRVVQLAPERRVLANSFADGRPLGRLNDLFADGQGGAFFTQTGLFHVNAAGNVTVVAEKVDAFTNGLALSPDGKVLYVTDKEKVLAFDVGKDGATTNRRVFATLSGEEKGFGGDGLAVDGEGRLYVTGDAGVHVLDRSGKALGVIPVPRRAITAAFAGPDRKTLYVGTMGAVGPDGKAWATPEGVRNVAMTIYRVPMLAAGPVDRLK
ncbi:SMP-30/gluconolactonase/LRE family protein [Altererythrobacter fulvus]|uniref:SMP-30/gluconolactonase/LRE family protein n=1 Tax=Caenibius fulvus TaxID=2126012 RepID=UPI003018E544